MEVRTQIFDVPTSTGNVSWTIDGWSETPVAVKIVCVKTDGIDSFDNTSEISIGFADGTNEYAVMSYVRDGVGSSSVHREARDDGCITLEDISGGNHASFSQFETGGVELTWSGTGMSSLTHKAIVTFFAGADVSAAVLTAHAGDHVESLDFTTKLMFTAGHGATTPGAAGVYIMTHGVMTNGVNGLEQNYVAQFWRPGVSTSEGQQTVRTAHISAQVAPNIDWETAVYNIDSVGFNFDGGNTDLIYMLCLDFDDDVDSGYSTVPTSGSINNTTPGFTPQIVGVVMSNNTDVSGTPDETTTEVVIGIGEYDGTRENSLTNSGEIGATTMNHTSVHSSNMLHTEDADQNDIIDSSSVTFESSGFDVAFTTHPSTETYYVWWAVEGEAGGIIENITGTANASSAVSGALTGRAQISGGTGLGADLKDAEEINDDANWVAFETAVITQNGSYVNIVSGTHSWGAFIVLDATVLTSDLTDGVEYSLRCVVQSENGAFNIRVRDQNGDMDTYSVSDGEIIRFSLNGSKNVGFVPYLTFENMGSGEEANVYIYAVAPTIGSTASGDLTEKQNDPITGTINGSSTVSGSIKAKGVLSGTINAGSITTGNIQATVPITGTVTTFSSVSGALTGRSELSATIATASTVTGALSYRAKITQNGAWVNIKGGSNPAAAYIYLDANVLISLIENGKSYAVRGVAWSVSGAVNVTLNDEAAGGSPRDSVAVASGEIKYFQLTGPKTVGGETPYISFSSFGPSNELNIHIYQVNEVVGSIVSADISFIEGNWIFGTVNGSSTVTGSIIAYGSMSGSASGSSTVSANIIATGSMAGTINASSTVSARLSTYVPISGTINASSSVTGFLQLGKIFGTINASSTVSGVISAKGVLSGTISSGSVTQAAIYGRGVLSGTINASSAASGRMILYASLLSGTINGGSTVTGQLRDGKSMIGVINGSSTVTGAIRGTGRLSGSIDASSSVTGAIRAFGYITGTINASSAVSADIHWKVETKYITGTINTASTVSAFHTSHARMIGTIATGSTVSGVMRGRAYLSGTINGSSTVSGHVQVIQYVSGTINGSSVVTGKMRGLSGLSGLVVAGSTVSGALTHKPNVKSISGTINTGSTVAGSMISYALASGTINAGSTVTAAIRRNIPITGTINGSSTVTADLFKKERKHISGSISGSTAASAKIIGRLYASGSIVTGSIVTGTIQAGTQLSGTANGSSIVTAKIRAVFAISGSIFAKSTVSGFMQHTISGTITTGSTVLGVISGRGQLQSAVIAGSVVTGRLSGRALISGTIETSSTLAGAVRAVVPISGVVTTSSSVTANLSTKTHKKEISGSTAGSSTVSGQLAQSSKMSGTIESGSTVTGKLVGKAAISGTVASNSSVSGTLRGMVYGSVTINSASIVAANLKGIGLLGGSTVGRSMVLGILRAKGVPFSELIDGFVLEDVIKASIFEQTFEGRVREVEMKMVAMDPNLKVVIDEPDLKLKVMEDTLDGIMEDEEVLI